MKTHLEAVRPRDMRMAGFLRSITRGICCIAVVDIAVDSTATCIFNVMSQLIVPKSRKAVIISSTLNSRVEHLS